MSKPRKQSRATTLYEINQLTDRINVVGGMEIDSVDEADIVYWRRRREVLVKRLNMLKKYLPYKRNEDERRNKQACEEQAPCR